jgi:hypothetical protein
MPMYQPPKNAVGRQITCLGLLFHDARKFCRLPLQDFTINDIVAKDIGLRI